MLETPPTGKNGYNHSHGPPREEFVMPRTHRKKLNPGKELPANSTFHCYVPSGVEQIAMKSGIRWKFLTRVELFPCVLGVANIFLAVARGRL